MFESRKFAAPVSTADGDDPTPGVEQLAAASCPPADAAALTDRDRSVNAGGEG